MDKGDISIEVTPRWLITIDALTSGKSIPQVKRFAGGWKRVARETPIDRQVLGRLWRFSGYNPARFELVTFGAPAEYAVALEEVLDSMGAYISWVQPYEDRKHLQSDLAYRPEVYRVIDSAEGILWWGSRGVSINEIG